MVKPDRDVRPFRRDTDLGARLGFPGLIKKDGQKRYPGGYPDYLANHERLPGVGMLAGFRGEDGSQVGRGSPNPNQIDAYVNNDSFWFQELRMIKSNINMEPSLFDVCPIHGFYQRGQARLPPTLL